MDTYIINKGSSKTVYFHVNADGFVFYKIQNESGTNKAKFWWVAGPFGSIKDVGFVKATGKLKIKGTLWGKLRIGHLDSKTIVQIHDQPRVGMNFPEINF